MLTRRLDFARKEAKDFKVIWFIELDLELN